MSSAPVAALTASPPSRTVQGGLLYPAPPADPALRKAGVSKEWVAFAVILALGSGLAGAFGISNPLLFVALPAFALAPVFMLRRQMRRANAKLGRAGALVQERKLVEAEALLTEIAHGAKGSRQIHVLSVLQLTSVHNLRGDVEKALELLAVVSRSKSLKRYQPALFELVPFQIARAYALLGETAAAEQWLAHGNQHRNFLQPHTADVVEALLRARQGRFTEATAHFERLWPLLETSATGDVMKAQRVLFAYSLAHTGGDDKRIELLLAGARPFGAEVRSLVWPWPELHEWLRVRVPDEAIPDPH